MGVWLTVHMFLHRRRTTLSRISSSRWCARGARHWSAIASLRASGPRCSTCATAATPFRRRPPTRRRSCLREVVPHARPSYVALERDPRHFSLSHTYKSEETNQSINQYAVKLEHVGPQHAQAPPVPQAIASRASAPRGGAPDVEEIISNGINSVILLLDVCYQTNPHHEDIQDNDLVRELLPQCRSVQARVRKVLESEQIYMAGSESLLHVVRRTVPCLAGLAVSCLALLPHSLTRGDVVLQALQFNDEMCRLDEALESLARGVAPKRPLPQQEDIPPELLRQLANEHGQQHQVPSRRTPDDFEDAPALSLDRQTRRPSSSAHAMPPSSSLIAAAAPVAQPQQHQHHVEQEQHQQPPTPNEFDLGIVLVPQPPKATRKRSTSTKTPSNDLLSPRDSASPRVLQPVAAAPPTAAPATPKAPATPSLPSDDPFMALASRLTTSPPSASASAPTPFGSSVPPTATAAAPTPSTMSLLAGIPFTQPQPQPQPAAMAPVMMQPMMAAQAMTPQQYQYALQQQQQYQMMLQRQQQQQQQQQQQRQSPAGTGAPWPSGSR